VSRHATSPSRYMSLVLRHKPEVAGVLLSPEGWASTDAVVHAVRARCGPFTRQDLRDLVASNDKQRFELSPNGKRVRAVQGHSVPVDLGLVAAIPPEVLYHGTTTQALDAIKLKGLLPMQRQYVHLKATKDVARQVARRRAGPHVLLSVAALECPRPFYMAANGVWLTDAVPWDYITPAEYF
jgi:putative RNA 2'-phosphotransferase